MSIEQLRKDNPQFASFSDDALIGMVSSQTGKSLQEVTSILVPGGDAAPQKLTPLQQVRKDNPSYAQYSDDALVGLISNQTGKSIQELRPILFQEPVEDDNREENPEALDYLKGFASGANKLVSGAGYLAELAGAKETGKSIREFGDRGAAYWNNRMTEGGKNAASTPVFEDDPESITGIKLTDDWGKALLMGASQSLPTMFAAAIPGVAVTKGIQALAKLGLAGGSGATIPLLAGTAAPVGIGSQAIARAPAAVGFGAAEGVTAGAINASEFKTAVEETSFDELSKSPVFQALKEQYGNEKAREMIAEQASQELFGKTALSTGAISVLTGGGALGQAYQKISGASKGGLFSQTIKGAGQEALQEAPQSAGEKLIENITTRDYLDPSQDIKEGVLADAASGAAIGGFTGGLFGAGSAINVTNRASKINEERTKLGLQKISESETVDEAIQSATETVSQKPVTPEDIWDSTDMRDELLERAKSINQQQDGVINETQTQGTEASAAAEILNDPGLTPDSIVVPDDADIPMSAFDGGKGRKQKETASNQSVIDSIANANTEVPTQRDSVLNSDIIAQNLSNSPRGNKSEIVLPNNTTLPAEWMVVDADSINATLKNGKNQPRDRSRISSDIQVQQIANNPDYRRLAESPVMDVGSPTISYDGAIVGGNGRFEGISRGYDAGTSVAYRAELESDAINKGIDPATFVGMKKPVLVRRITQPFDIKKLAVASNSGTSLEYSALERAKIDSERIGDIDKIEVNDSGDIALTKDNISNIRDSLKDYNTTEFGSFVDNEGNISQEGARRLKNAILYSAYGDSKTLSRMVESTDSDMRNIIGALTRVGGQVSKVRSDIKAGVLPKELDITDNLIDAVEKIGQLRANGISVQKHMSQQGMFHEIETSQESKEIVQVLSELMRSQKRMTDFMRSMYDSISKIDITTNNIFGEQDAPKKLEVIKNAKRQQETTTKPTDSLFEETGSKSGAKKDSTGSGKESAKYSRSAGERLKDRERTKKLEKTLKKQGFNFTITPKDVRDFAAMDRGKENEAVTAERIARIFKKRITWIEAKGDFHINGVTLPSIQDTIFIDVTTDKYAHAVVGHELSHHMENDVPKVYQDLVNALSDIIPNTDEYAKKYGIKGADDAYIIKEIVGDIVGDNFTDPKFWDKVAAHNPNAFRRISDSIITWLKRLVTNARLRGLGSEKWVTDAQKAQDIVAKAVAQYTTLSSNPSKEDDQKPTVTIKKKRTIEPKFSFAGEKSGTANRYQLSNAKEKLANGADKETVRKETLSQAGVDTKPKEETGKLPEETKMQAFRRRTQDAMLRFKVVQQWLDDQDVKLSEAANVYQRENISKGKMANKIEDFRREQLEPLIKQIAETSNKAGKDGKFDLSDIATYLEAVHIPEANKRMRLIHKDKKATANGITDSQARKVISEFKKMPNFDEFKKLADKVRNIGTETLDMRLDAGLISQEQYDAYKATYKQWVPLRGNDSKQGFGKGLSTNSKDKRRMGHGFREDEFVIENLVQDRERAIMQIEKNKVGLSVASFLIEAQNANIGTVGEPEKMRVMKDFSYAVTFKGRIVGSFETESGARNAIHRISEKSGDLVPDGESFTQTDFEVKKNYDPHIVMAARPQLQENEIQVYVNGHAVRLQLNDPGLARAATNAGIEQVGAITNAARQFNRFLSKAYTAWSPDFLFMNMARDAYSGTMVLTGKKGSAFFAKVLANYGTSVKELIKGRNDPKKSKWIKRYRNAGGNIGAAYLSDIERIGEDAVAALQEFAGARETYRMEYNNQISRGSSEKKARTMAALKASVAKTKAMPVVGHMFKTLENMNMIIENALRLATFKTAIEQGESDQQAAMLSRDLMNFNRKGEMANKMGAAYLFYNPGMQGIHIVGEALFTSKHRKQVWALLGALTSISFMLSELARGGGDDEDEREWENIPDYIKDRNLILKVGDHQITIPVAYGFGIFHAMGNYLSDLNHGADINEVSVKLASGMFENFSVFGNPILDDGEDIRLDQLLPTLPKIIMAPGINMDGLGRQIHPEKAVWNESIPDSQNMFRSVRGTAYEDITNFMNEVTGGSKYNPGAIDISPNTVKYWVTSLTGGAGRFVSDVVTGSVGAAQGVTPELENIPVARKFIRQSGVSDSRSAFHNARKEVEAATQRFRKAVKDGDVFNSQKILGENKEIIALSDFTSDSRKLSAAKRDSILNIQQDKSLSKAEKKVKIREIELQEQRIYDRFLRIFDQKKAKQSDQ